MTNKKDGKKRVRPLCPGTLARIASGEDLFENACLMQRLRTLESALNALTEREHQVMRLRFGLDDGEERNFGNIAEILGIDRDRVRHLEAKALRRLRHGLRLRLLTRDEL